MGLRRACIPGENSKGPVVGIKEACSRGSKRPGGLELSDDG